MQRKNELTIVLWIFHTPKTSFLQKYSKSARQIHFSKKRQKTFDVFIYGLFEKDFISLKSKSVRKKRKLGPKIEVEDKIQKTDGEDEETVLDF